MLGKRLKEKIRWQPPGSRFAAWTGLFLAMMAIFSVFLALDDTHYPRVLPASGSPKSSDGAVITASANHTYYWDESGPFPIDQFRVRLASWLTTVKTPRLSIAGDRNASFGDTARLINEVRLQGIDDFKIQTQMKERP